jgi:hypothetical protein
MMLVRGSDHRGGWVPKPCVPALCPCAVYAGPCAGLLFGGSTGDRFGGVTSTDPGQAVPRPGFPLTPRMAFGSLPGGSARAARYLERSLPTHHDIRRPGMALRSLSRHLSHPRVLLAPWVEYAQRSSDQQWETACSPCSPCQRASRMFAGGVQASPGSCQRRGVAPSGLSSGRAGL